MFVPSLAAIRSVAAAVAKNIICRNGRTNRSVPRSGARRFLTRTQCPQALHHEAHDTAHCPDESVANGADDLPLELQKICDLRNVSIYWFWEGGIVLRRGDERNGYQAEEIAGSATEDRSLVPKGKLARQGSPADLNFPFADNPPGAPEGHRRLAVYGSRRRNDFTNLGAPGRDRAITRSSSLRWTPRLRQPVKPLFAVR
jgi:hypothetical protein